MLHIMATVKPEPIDTEAEQTFLANSSNGSARRRPPAHGVDAAAMSRVTSRPASHPVNFLTTEHGRPEMVVDPVQEDVVFLPPRGSVLGGRGHAGHGRREVTEYATYTISHHEEELNSKLLPKKYRCRFCVYKTSYKSDLNRHLRKHGIAPQHCPLCNMPFKTTGNLENHMRQTHGDFVSGMGIMPSPVPGLGVEEGLVPPIAVGALGGVLNFAQSKPDIQLRSPEESRRHHQHHHRRLQLQQDFPAVSQLVLSPAQLSCHVCPFVCGDSEVLARHLLTHPSEDEASRAPQSSPSPADVSATRLACNYCGMILSSIDHLQLHRRSCVNPEDSQGKGSGGLNHVHGDAGAVSQAGHRDDEGLSRKTEKLGLPRKETMDKLRRTITNQDDARLRSDSQSPADRNSSWNKEQKSMVLPHIPAAAESADAEKTDQNRADPPSVVHLGSSPDGSPGSMFGIENNVSYKPPDQAKAPADGDRPATSQSRATPSGSHLECNRRKAEQGETPSSRQGPSQLESGNGTDVDDEPRKSLTRRNKRSNENVRELSESVQNALPLSPTDRETEGPREVNREFVERCSEVAGEHGQIPISRNKAPDCSDSCHKRFKSADYSKQSEGASRSPNHSGTPVHHLSTLQGYHEFDQAGERYIKEEPKSPETLMEHETSESSRTYDGFPGLRSEVMRSASSAGPRTLPSGHREHAESCVLCEQRFRSRTHLIRHLLRVHSLVTTRSSSGVGQVNVTMDPGDHGNNHITNTSQHFSRDNATEPERRERRGARQRESMFARSKSSASTYFVPSAQQASSASAMVMPAGGSLRSENRERSLSFPADSRDKRAADQPFYRGYRDARVVSAEPPSSGRYAKLVSDFDEFSTKPYACSLCFFRTASLGDLRVHVHNHLTGCNASPIPDTARFQPMEVFHVECSTSPLRPDSSAASSVGSASPVSIVASDAPAVADLDVAFERTRGFKPAFDRGRSVRYRVIDDDHRESFSEGESDQSHMTGAEGRPLVSTTIGSPDDTHMIVNPTSTDGSSVVDLSSRTVREIYSPEITQVVDNDDVTSIPLTGDGCDYEKQSHNNVQAERRVGIAHNAHQGGGVGSNKSLKTSASLNTFEERLCDAEHSTGSVHGENELHETKDLQTSSRSSNNFDERLFTADRPEEDDRLPSPNITDERLFDGDHPPSDTRDEELPDEDHPAEDDCLPSSNIMDERLLVGDHPSSDTHDEEIPDEDRLEEDDRLPSSNVLDERLLGGDHPSSDIRDEELPDEDHPAEDDQRLRNAVFSQPYEPPKRFAWTSRTRHHNISERNHPPEAKSRRKVNRKQVRKSSPKITQLPKRRSIWLRACLLRKRSGLDGSNKNRCTECGKAFSLGLLLARHMRFVHVA